MKRYINCFMLCICIVSLHAQSIIPKPMQYTPREGMYTLDSRTTLRIASGDDQTKMTAKLFLDRLKEQCGISLNLISDATPSHQILLKLDASLTASLGAEGYLLKVGQNSIECIASSNAGLQYGLTTLLNQLPIGGSNRSITLLCQEVMDKPRFEWRGLMLDVSRHFFSVEDVKKFIDVMSYYKLNTFHWHLTDDEGWRIEIKSLPKLTSVGAWRVERHGKFGDGRPYPKPNEATTYGGYYTHEQIKDVVQYASARNITIVPEIDIPGHSMAALAAYPELSVKQEAKFVNPGSRFAEWFPNGTFKMLIENTLNPTDEKVYEFVDKVFAEVAMLFPGKYIHMGGDECYKGFWEENTKVQAFMKKNGIKDSHELQSYFVKRVQKIVASKGKELIGWDEILEGGLAEGAAVMSWRGMKGGIEAAKMGHKVVMSPTTYAYLDYTQGDVTVENQIYASLSLEKSYEFEPVPEGVDPKMILGGQGNVWTEMIPDLDFALYMTYPRALAIAETVWSPKEQKNWSDFLVRAENEFDRFDAQGLSICKAVYDPQVSTYTKDGALMLKLSNGVPGAEIRYSLNNTYPLHKAQKYAGEIEVPPGTLSLRTQVYRNGQPIGRMLTISREELVKRGKK